MIFTACFQQTHELKGMILEHHSSIEGRLCHLRNNVLTTMEGFLWCCKEEKQLPITTFLTTVSAFVKPQLSVLEDAQSSPLPPIFTLSIMESPTTASMSTIPTWVFWHRLFSQRPVRCFNLGWHLIAFVQWHTSRHLTLSTVGTIQQTLPQKGYWERRTRVWGRVNTLSDNSIKAARVLKDVTLLLTYTLCTLS